MATSIPVRLGLALLSGSACRAAVRWGGSSLVALLGLAALPGGVVAQQAESPAIDASPAVVMPVASLQPEPPFTPEAIVPGLPAAAPLSAPAVVAVDPIQVPARAPLPVPATIPTIVNPVAVPPAGSQLSLTWPTDMLQAIPPNMRLGPVINR